MKAIYINPFIKATISVLQVMANVKTRAEKPYLKQDEYATGDVTTIVGLTGQSSGTFSISFERSCIVYIAASMFGENITEQSSEVNEVSGELANMVSGQARREIEGLGLLLDGAIPSVFSGDGHKIFHMTNGPKIAIPFVTDGGKFTMEVCFDF